MKMIKKFKLLFTLAALCMFMYQITSSVQKYQNPPIIQATTTKILSDKEKPLFYVCEQSQFNVKEQNRYGYHQIQYLILGLVNSRNTPTWKGLHGNLTFMDLMNTVSEFNYTDLNVLYGTANEEPEFRFPYGFCKKLSFYKITKFGKFLTSNQVKFLALDPLTENAIKLDERASSVYSLNKDATETTYEWARIKITVEVHDASLREGQVCTNYENKNSR